MRLVPSKLAILALLFTTCGVTSAQQLNSPSTDWWSLKPLTSPQVPVIEDNHLRDWPRNPIDCFILWKSTGWAKRKTARWYRESNRCA